MKRIWIVLLLGVLFIVNSYSQEKAGIDTVKHLKDTLKDIVFTSVEIQAEFPGGVTGWCQFLQKHLRTKVPGKNGAPVGKYTVSVLFVVDKEGNISDISIKNDPGFGTAQEVLRVLKKSPKWTPGEQNGRVVKSWRTQNITFQVEEG